MSIDEWVAVWGMSSLGIGFLSAMVMFICFIWHAEFAAMVAGTVVTVCLFSLFAALYAQAAIDRAAGS